MRFPAGVVIDGSPSLAVLGDALFVAYERGGDVRVMRALGEGPALVVGRFPERLAPTLASGGGRLVLLTMSGPRDTVVDLATLTNVVLAGEAVYLIESRRWTGGGFSSGRFLQRLPLPYGLPGPPAHSSQEPVGGFLMVRVRLEADAPAPPPFGPVAAAFYGARVHLLFQSVADPEGLEERFTYYSYRLGRAGGVVESTESRVLAVDLVGDLGRPALVGFQDRAEFGEYLAAFATNGIGAIGMRYRRSH